MNKIIYLGFRRTRPTKCHQKPPTQICTEIAYTTRRPKGYFNNLYYYLKHINIENFEGLSEYPPQTFSQITKIKVDLTSVFFIIFHNPSECLF